MRRMVALVALLAAAALTASACAAEEPGTEPGVPAAEPTPFESCPVGANVAPSGEPAGAPMIPAITLPCFTGGHSVDLARLGRPAVINLWASWCRPCRAELPEFQRFADDAGDGLIVLGVVTGDTRSAAAGVAEDTGITFPAVFDADESLRRGLGRAGLPITIFVDARGGVRHIYQASQLLTRSTLRTLAREHLGAVV